MSDQITRFMSIIKNTKGRDLLYFYFNIFLRIVRHTNEITNYNNYLLN